MQGTMFATADGSLHKLMAGGLAVATFVVAGGNSATPLFSARFGMRQLPAHLLLPGMCLPEAE